MVARVRLLAVAVMPVWDRVEVDAGARRSRPPSPGARRAAARRGGRPTPSSAGLPSGAVRLHASSVTSRRRLDALSRIDPFGARARLGPGLPDLYRVSALDEPWAADSGLPITVRILLENLLRHAGGGIVETADVETLASWRPGVAAEAEIPFMPSRVIMQDLTGVPAVVDLAVMRDAMADLGGDPGAGQPAVPADLVIDHSVHVDRFGTSDSFASTSSASTTATASGTSCCAGPRRRFANLRIVPPGTGIVHQVNLEFLAPVIDDRDGVAFPDTLVGHRFAHDDDQRARSPRLRRRRDRGRGRAARPAALPADAACRRRPAGRRAAEGLHRDGPRPGRDRDACGGTAWSARSSSSPATGSPACPWPTARRSAT